MRFSEHNGHFKVSKCTKIVHVYHNKLPGQRIYTTSVIFVKPFEFFRNYTKLAMSTIKAYVGIAKILKQKNKTSTED